MVFVFKNLKFIAMKFNSVFSTASSMPTGFLPLREIGKWSQILSLFLSLYLLNYKLMTIQLFEIGQKFGFI